jgi:tetratricopeptide (TPR) repeat protein
MIKNRWIVRPRGAAADELLPIEKGQAVSSRDRVRRQQILREAEGYLDLAMMFNEAWMLLPERRQALAERSLAALDRLGAEAAEEAEALFLRGQALRTMEKYRAALEPLQLAVQLDPKNVDIYLALAWCYKRTGQLKKAIESLEEALAVEPTTAILHYNLACYWSLAKNKRKSIQYLSQALKLDENYRHLVDSEPDFDPIRDDPRFRALTAVIV